jgi:hypothetical protein
MRIYASLIYIFLYAPIALIVALSFNAGKQSMVWTGFSVEWYGKAFSNPLITEALGTSVMIAFWRQRCFRPFSARWPPWGWNAPKDGCGSCLMR